MTRPDTPSNDLSTPLTVDREKIQTMQARKADLARAVLEGGSSKKLRFDEADLEALLGPQ